MGGWSDSGHPRDLHRQPLPPQSMSVVRDGDMERGDERRTRECEGSVEGGEEGGVHDGEERERGRGRGVGQLGFRVREWVIRASV